MGTTIETLVQLCKKYPAVVEAIDQLLKEESSHGGDHKSEKIKLYNIQLDLTNSKKAPSGTSLQRSLRRLRNLAAVDEKARELREKVLRGEMSASRALKELGKQKVRYAVEATPESIAEFAKKRLSKQGLRKLKNLLE